jgi:ferredoxin-NADP reductase
MIQVHFDHSKEIAKNIRSFYFKPISDIKQIAGQFIELYIPHENPDEHGIKHWFTLSSSPTEDLWTITTKLNPECSSTFKTALQNLQPGTELTMAAPMGDFVLPKDPAIPLLFVAGGIGCTPYRSMIKYLQDTREKRDITLLYATSSAEEIAFRDVFEVLNSNFIPLVGDRLTSAKILEYASPRHYIYLSGPEPMIEILDNELKEAGADPDHLRTDFFPNYTTI